MSRKRVEYRDLVYRVWSCYDDTCDLDRLRELVEEFPELLTPYRPSESLLCIAMASRDYAACEVLVGLGWPLDGDTSDYLEAAVQSGDPVFVAQAIALGMDPNGSAPVLHSAVESGSARIVRLVLKAGANVASISNGWTALHLAAAWNDLNAIRQLLKFGAAVDARDIDDGASTPLMEAASRGSKEAALLLLREGADRNARSMFGKRPADWAASEGHHALSKLLA